MEILCKLFSCSISFRVIRKELSSKNEGQILTRRTIRTIYSIVRKFQCEFSKTKVKIVMSFWINVYTSLIIIVWSKSNFDWSLYKMDLLNTFHVYDAYLVHCWNRNCLLLVVFWKFYEFFKYVIFRITVWNTAKIISHKFVRRKTINGLWIPVMKIYTKKTFERQSLEYKH